MDIKITKREILFSVVIVIVLLCVGFLISNNIDSALLDSFQDYDNALKIDNDKEMFEYGMRTSVGKAFIYGEVKAIDTVSYPDIDGDYSFIRKDTERYTKHYRTVTKTRKNSKGETERYTEEEEYYITYKINKKDLTAFLYLLVFVETCFELFSKMNCYSVLWLNLNDCVFLWVCAFTTRFCLWFENAEVFDVDALSVK